MDGQYLIVKFEVLRSCKSLSTVAQGLFRPRVNLDDQPVGPDGNSGSSKRSDHIIVAASVRRIDDDRQMR